MTTKRRTPDADPGTADGGTRPLRADARRNRARILAAAEDAFAAEGLAVPLDDIARRAGVGAGTVYRHFPTKEALFEAVIGDRGRQLVDDARSLTTAEDPADAFFRFLARMVESGRAKRDLVDALVGAGADVPMAASVKREIREAGAILLDRAQQAGAVRGDLTIADLMAMLTGMILSVQSHESGDPGVSQRMYQVLRDGLRAGDSSPPAGEC